MLSAGLCHLPRLRSPPGRVTCCVCPCPRLPRGPRGSPPHGDPGPCVLHVRPREAGMLSAHRAVSPVVSVRLSPSPAGPPGITSARRSGPLRPARAASRG
ncbi:hypothetical protein VULLAG_LOCUS5726 [Vulpes lagopus]